MFPFTLHTALNLLWLGISVSALSWFAGTEWRRTGSGRWRRLLAVFGMCVTLFPSVSDTDDLFNFSLMQVPGQQHPPRVGRPPADGAAAVMAQTHREQATPVGLEQGARREVGADPDEVLLGLGLLQVELPAGRVGLDRHGVSLGCGGEQRGARRGGILGKLRHFVFG